MRWWWRRRRRQWWDWRPVVACSSFHGSLLESASWADVRKKRPTPFVVAHTASWRRSTGRATGSQQSRTIVHSGIGKRVSRVVTPVVAFVDCSEPTFQKQNFAVNSSPPAMYSAWHWTRTFECAERIDFHPSWCRHFEPSSANAPRYGFITSHSIAADAAAVLLKKAISASVSVSSVIPGPVVSVDDRVMSSASSDQ